MIQRIENIRFLFADPAIHDPATRAGQNVSAASDFMSDLRTALIGSGIAELTGVAIAFAFIRRDSLHAKT